MSHHHARATPARPASGAPMDPWLRMRMAPVRSRRPASDGATVRAALRTIASARPNPATLALELRRVRAQLDRERARLRGRLADGASADEIAQAEARLLDGTLIGLCHLARRLLLRPAGMVPPLAVLALGDYGPRQLAPGVSAELLLLVAADPLRRDQGLAMAQFVACALAGLGWQASVAKRTVRGCFCETHLDPAIAADLAAARLLWGCHGLFAELRAKLGQARRHDPAPAIRRLPQHRADLALVA